MRLLRLLFAQPLPGLFALHCCIVLGDLWLAAHRRHAAYSTIVEIGKRLVYKCKARVDESSYFRGCLSTLLIVLTDWVIRQVGAGGKGVRKEVLVWIVIAAVDAALDRYSRVSIGVISHRRDPLGDLALRIDIAEPCRTVASRNHFDSFALSVCLLDCDFSQIKIVFHDTFSCRVCLRTRHISFLR